MLVIHGTYHWRRQLLAFRNDYCLTCARPRLAYLHRTFDVLHVFWIPVLPLGFWTRWHCAECGSKPHVRITASRTIRWSGIALLVFSAIVFWLIPLDAKGGKDADPVMIWTFRVTLPVAAAVAIHYQLRAKPPERLADKLRGIQPNRDSTCPRCGATMLVAAPWYRCSRCGLERRALPPV